MNPNSSPSDPADTVAIREGAAIGAISRRSQIAVAGADRAAYLQGLLTNDIQALKPGSGCYAAWLSAHGRMLTDMHVLQSDAMILLDVPAEQAGPTIGRLDQFLFSEDVRLESLDESMTSVWLHGPRAAAVLANVVSAFRRTSDVVTRTSDVVTRTSDVESGFSRIDSISWADYQHGTATFEGTPVSVARIDQLGVPGFCVFLPRGAEERFTAAAVGHGARVVSSDAINAARIEAGYPVFGADMTEDTIPLEAGIEERAISFTKGCFVGQEVVIRVLHRGGGRVARRLVGLKLASPVSAGSKISSGGKDVGVITSAAISPTLGPIALGYVHRDFTAAGTNVEVDGHPASVTVLPMA